MATTDCGARTDEWHLIPGTDENHRVTDGQLSLYVGPSGKRGPRGVYREGFDHRWTIWAHGSLLGEGFTDSLSSAKSACVQEAERVAYRIKEAVKALAIQRYY